MSKKIVLADDSITIQKVISITFASEDYDLTVVGDGDSAIAKAKEVAPDLIMADVAMPGKNGYEVCEAIKNDPALSGIPVMLLAGTFEPLNEADAKRVGADDHIVKPFESEDLITKVRALLASSGGGPAPAALEPTGAPAPQSATETIIEAPVLDLEAPSLTPAEPAAVTAEPGSANIADATWDEGDFLEAVEEVEEVSPEDESTEPDFAFLEDKPAPTPATAPAPAAAEGTQQGDFIDFDLTEPAPKPASAPVPTPPEPASPVPAPVVEEISPDEITFAEPEPAPTPTPTPTPTPEPTPEPDFSSFTEPEPTPAPEQTPPAVEEISADEISFAAPEPTPAPEPDFSSFTEPEPAPAPSSTPTPTPAPAIEETTKEITFDTVSEPAPAPTPAPEPAPAQVEATEANTPPVAAGEPIPGIGDVSREEILAMIEKAVKEIVEEIAWEVVPEMAEELLKTEIIDKVKGALTKK